jgi:ABC-type branched-subunit amino acid transport system substrate-binding protein
MRGSLRLAPRRCWLRSRSPAVVVPAAGDHQRHEVGARPGRRQGRRLTIKYVSLDDSKAQAGTSTPEATSANARQAAQDDSTIAYLGEFNSGASAVSMPILNETGVPQNGAAIGR